MGKTLEQHIYTSDPLIKKWAQNICFFIITLSTFVLLSWFIEKPFLAGFSYSYVPMAPSTAVVFLLLSGSIRLISHKDRSAWKRNLALLALLISFIISSVLLFLFYNSIRAGYEHLFFDLPDKVNNIVIGHMSPLTATCFLLAITSLSIIILYPENILFMGISGILASVLFFTGTILFLGYIYHSPFLYGTEVIPVALTTSIGFIALGIALILAAGESAFPLRQFYGKAMYNRLLRAFIPVTASFILIQDWLLTAVFPYIGHHIFITAIISVISVITLAVMISRISADISKHIEHNITERRRAEEELKAANSELMSVNRIVTASTSILNLKEILGKILDEVIGITGMDGGSICLLNTEHILKPMAFRNISPEMIKDFNFHQIKEGECLCDKCALDHKRFIYPDMEKGSGYSSAETLIGRSIYFYATFPLITVDKCVGVLCIFARSHKRPSERALLLIDTVTPQIAMTIENSKLYEEVLSNSINLENKVALRTRELEAANLKLKEIDRLKSIFIASVSHELRTPLNAVIGFSSILIDHWVGPLNEEQKDLLNSILKSGKHLLSLINEMIDISKIEAGNLDIQIEEFSVSDLISEAVEGLRKEADDKGLFIKTEPAAYRVKTDKKRLLQSVLNLASNAVKFTEKGGITIILSQKDEDRLEISVEDTGIGIKEEDIEKLFQPFVRIKDSTTQKNTGTGLGLYLTKKIVTEVLKGGINVVSTLGKGSVFTLSMPMNLAR